MFELKEFSIRDYILDKAEINALENKDKRRFEKVY